MSIGSEDELDEGNKKKKGAMKRPAATSAAGPAGVVSPTSIMATPQAKGAVAAGSPGAHVSIVTPDGQPLHIPTTPVNVRKLDIDTPSPTAGSSNMMDISTSASAAEAASAVTPGQQQQQQLKTPSSTSSLPTMDALNVHTSSEALANMKEGDQANALLSRRLDHARQQHQHQHQHQENR